MNTTNLKKRQTNNVKLLFYCFIGILVLAGCDSGKPGGIITIDILDGLKTEKEFRLSEIVDGVEYVKLETKPECLLSNAVFLVGKNYIMVVQSHNPAQIFLFDRTGRYLRKIGGEGKGPQEYTSLSSVAMDPEETYILANDYQRDILLKYDFQGNVIQSYNYKEKLEGDVADFVIKNSNEIVFRLDYPLQEKKNFYLIRKMNRELNQVDSLYPVTTTSIQGNGWSWGTSDLFLQDGSIQFRPFSFDTVFGESNGKLIPRIFFPVAADHLPGPYLVSGLHKQMGEYTSIWNFFELTDYLILNTRIVPGKGGVMVYNKSNGEIFRLRKYPPCPPDTVGRRLMINDIDGINHPMILRVKNGLGAIYHQVIDLKEAISGKCPEVKEIRFPEKRQELIDLVKKSKDDDNPILQIFHLK